MERDGVVVVAAALLEGGGSLAPRTWRLRVFHSTTW